MRDIGLECSRGRATNWLATVTESDDATEVSLTGKSLRFRVALDWDDAHLIELSTGSGITHANQATNTGEATIALAAADTSIAAFSTSRATHAVYQLDLIDGSSTYTVARGRLTVKPSLA